MHLHSWLGFSMVHVSFRECTPNATPPRMHYYHVRFPGVTWISPVSASIFVSPSGSGRWRGRSQWGGGWGRWHQEGSTGMEGRSQPGIHRCKPTCFLKINGRKMYSLPKEFLFRRHVSFRGVVIHPGKSTFWTQKWRFGSDDFPDFI